MSIVDASVWFDVFNGVSTPEVERPPAPGRTVSGRSKIASWMRPRCMELLDSRLSLNSWTRMQLKPERGDNF